MTLNGFFMVFLLLSFLISRRLARRVCPLVLNSLVIRFTWQNLIIYLLFFIVCRLPEQRMEILYGLFVHGRPFLNPMTTTKVESNKTF